MANRVIIPTASSVQTPTITTSAYSAGQAIGGLLTFSLIANQMQGSGRITNVLITDISNQRSAIDLVLFSQTFTATANGSAFAPSNADLLNCIGFINIIAGSYSQFSANTAGIVQVPNFKFVLPEVSVVTTDRIRAKETTLFGQLVSRGTPTYATTTALSVSLIVEID